jgi:hypothetical protein
MIDCKLLCRKHLLAEHGEIHKHKHNFEKKHSMLGRIGQIEPLKMKIRHDELAKEMISRGYKHNSEYVMPDISYLSKDELNSKVDLNKSIIDLINRCAQCGSAIEDLYKGE